MHIQPSKYLNKINKFYFYIYFLFFDYSAEPTAAHKAKDVNASKGEPNKH